MTWTVRVFVAVLAAILFAVEIVAHNPQWLFRPEPVEISLPTPGECPTVRVDLDPEETGCQRTLDDLLDGPEAPDPYADPLVGHVDPDGPLADRR